MIEIHILFLYFGNLFYPYILEKIIFHSSVHADFVSELFPPGASGMIQVLLKGNERWRRQYRRFEQPVGRLQSYRSTIL